MNVGKIAKLTSSTLLQHWALFVVLVAGLIAGTAIGRCSEDPVVYEEVVVKKIIRPEIKLGWLQRILTSESRIDQRAVQRGGAVQQVLDFCTPVDIAYSTELDSVPEVPLPEVKTAILDFEVSDGMFYHDVDIYAMQNTGDLVHDQHKKIPGHVTGGADADSTWVRGDYGAWAKPIGIIVGAFGVGVGVGMALK